MRFAKDIIIGEIPTASNSNYSALFQEDGQVRKRTLGSIITQDIDAYLSGISVSFPTSIFNVADTSITPTQPNLVVSLKNQLAGTVFAAPETLNGTPSFRKLADVDLDQTTVAFQDDIPTNYITTDTDQTGLSGNKTTSGVWNFTGNNAVPLMLNRSTPNNILLRHSSSNSTIYSGIGDSNMYAIGDSADLRQSANNWRVLINNNGRIFSKTDGDSSEWKQAYDWGNHANAGYLTPVDLSGYVPTSRTLTAGNGLTGGGNLTTNRTFTLGTPSAITLSSTNSVTSTSHTHAFTPGGTTAQYIRGDGSLATLPDNYLRLGSYTTSQDGYGTSEDVFNLRNTVAWATSSANRPNNTNSAIVAFTPYKSGTSEYGFFLGARSNRLWLSTLENSVPSGWVEIAKRSEFGNYLPLSGGTMTGNINWNSINIGLTYNNTNRLRFTDSITVLSSNQTGTALGIYLRPQGDNTSTGQVTIQANGQINTANHGNSSQWKQAYDWGNFRDYGLGTGANVISDFDNQPAGSMGYTTSATLNQPSGLGYGSLFRFGSTSSFTQLFGAYTQSNRLFFRHNRNGVYYPLVEIYHTDNLTFGTGLTYNSTTGVLTASQDSIFAYSPQGGLYTTDWSSTALGQHSVAIGYTSIVTASSSISIGKGVFTGGAMSQNIGFSSNVNKALSTNVGSYNLNNGELGNTFGQGLINQGMGTTVIGKYNQVVHHQENMDVDEKTPAIQFGVGKDELTRRNAITIFNDRRMDYDAQRDDSSWHQYTIPDIKWIQENISGGGGGGNLNFTYIDHTNTQTFSGDEANGLLIPSSLAFGSPLNDPILNEISVFTSHDDLGRYSTPTVDTFFNPIAVGVKAGILVRQGCIKIGEFDIKSELSGEDKLVMVYNRRDDLLYLEWMDIVKIIELQISSELHGILIGNAFNGDATTAYFNVNPQVL